MPPALHAKELPLAKIFSDDYAFTVPGYQRPYSWGIEQVDELLADLKNALEDAPENIGEASPYFLGSIVLIKQETSAEATVVDGQQRLTTLTLLLSAARSVISNPAFRQGITNRIYEAGDEVTMVAPRYRLTIRPRDNLFFREHIQNENGLEKLEGSKNSLTDAQSRLRANALHLLRSLRELEEEEVRRLATFVVNRCYLVVVSTPDLDSAYRIFGVMNSRGLDLTATDILKAEILGAIPENLRDSYTKLWEEQEEDLGRDRFSELFSHIRMVYRKSKSRGTLLKEFRHHVPLDEPSQFIEKVLAPMAKAYQEITDAEYSSTQLAEEVNERFRWLNRLDFSDWIPPALAYFTRHQNDPVTLLRFVTDLERLSYSLLIRKAGINERLDRFSKLTDAIEKAADLHVEQSPLQLTPIEQYETYSKLDGPLYESHSYKALSAILLRLDSLLSDKLATYQHDVLTIEHVMPQHFTTNSLWQTWVPDREQQQT